MSAIGVRDLTGQSFGRWIVLGAAGQNKHRQGLWAVRCVCGTIAQRTAADLRAKSQSCGCLRAEQVAARNKTAAGRTRRQQPERPCDFCRRSYRPKSKRSRYCCGVCRTSARYYRLAADSQWRAERARSVTDAYKEATYIEHDACDQCGQPFRGPPSRLHCSRDCLTTAIRSGKYRHAFQRRRALAELAELDTELHRRLADAPNAADARS